MKFLYSFVVLLFVNITCITSVAAKRKDERPPLKALEGDTITLSCDRGTVTTDTLYAVKWYKDEKEFFRNYPKKTNDTEKVFSIDGFTVQTPLPNPWEVVLQNINTSASGKYTCMVVDYPRYRTIYRSTVVEVTGRNDPHQSHPPDSSRSGSGLTTFPKGAFYFLLIVTVSHFM